MDHELTSHCSTVDLHDGDESKYRCEKCNIKKVRNPDGTLKLRNPNISTMSSDYLYHLALSTLHHNLQDMFGKVKFVITGGTPERMKCFAEHAINELNINIPAGLTLYNMSKIGHRYSMYKVGPIISVSHGMGGPSIGILLHELIKLMYYAKVQDPIFMRVGTSGGVGLPAGTVVISEASCDPLLNYYYTIPILGKVYHRPTTLDKTLVKELKDLSNPSDHFTIESGVTMCTDDFYEGQGRIDGAFAEHTVEEKKEFLNKIYAAGVRNIEMESTVFAAHTYHAGIKAGVVCVTLLNRLEGDQINSSPEVLSEFQERPMNVVLRYIKKYYKNRKRDF